MATIKEVRTLFTLDAKNFEQQAKGLDVIVKSVGDNVKQATQESLALSKEMNTVKKALQDVAKESTTLKSDDAFGNINRDVKETVQSLNTLNANMVQYRNHMRQIKSDLRDVTQNMSRGFNMTDIGRLASIVRDMKNTNIIDMTNLSRAQTAVSNMASDLRNIEIDIDISDLQTRLNSLTLGLGGPGGADPLRHWIDNNGNRSSQDADDTQRTMKEILLKVTAILSHMDGTTPTPGGDTQDNSTKKVMADIQRMLRQAYIPSASQASQASIAALGQMQVKGQSEMVRILKTINQSIISAAEAVEHAVLKLDGKEYDADRRYGTERVGENEAGILSGKAYNVYEDIADSMSEMNQNAEQVEATFESIRDITIQIAAQQTRVGQIEDELTQATDERAENLTEERVNIERMIAALQEQLVLQRGGLANLGNHEEIQRRITEEMEKQNQRIRENEARMARLRANPESANPFGDGSDAEAQRQIQRAEEQNRQARILIQLLGQEQAERTEALNQQRRQTEEAEQQADAQRDVTEEIERSGSVLWRYFSKKLPGLSGFIEEMRDIGQTASGATRGLGVFGRSATQAAGSAGQAGAAGASGARGLGSLGASATTAGAALGAIVVVVAAVIAAIVALVAAVALVAKAFTAVISAAEKFDNAVGKVAAQLRLTGEEATKFRDSLIGAFSGQGLTDDIAEVALSLRLVKQAIGGITEGFTEADAQRLAKNLLLVSKVTDYDMKEIVRAQQRMMINLGVSADYALDLIMGTYQATGDLNDDMLDTFSEYSTQFQKLGYSANFFYGIVTTASQAGVMNMDKAADTVKEFGIRMTTDADTSRKALAKVGLSYNQLVEGMKKGGAEAENVFARVATEIGNLEDKALQADIISSLFGAPGEDAGSKFFEALADANIAVDGFKGSIEDAAAAMENTLGYQTTQLKNMFTGIIGSLGNEIVPAIKAVVADINDNLDSIKSRITDILGPAFLQLAADILIAFNLDHVGSFSDMLIGVVEIFAEIIRFVGKTIKAVMLVAQTLRLLFNIVKFIVEAIILGAVSVIAACAEIVVFIMNAVGQIINGVMLVLEVILKGLSTLVLGVANAASQIILAISGVCEGIVRGFDDAFMLVIKAVGNVGIGIINGITWAAKEAANAFTKWMLNPIIDAYNKSIAMIPGVDKINAAGTFNTSSRPLDYISMGDEWNGIKDAFTVDNASFDVMGDVQGFFNDQYSALWSSLDSIGMMKGAQEYYNDMYKSVGQAFIGPMKSLMESMDGSIAGMGDAWSAIINIASTDSDEAVNRLKDMVAQSRLTKEEADKAGKALKAIFNQEDGYEGTDPGDPEKGKTAAANKLKDIADKAKLAEEAAKKALEAHKARLEYAKKMLEASKRAAENERKFNEIIFGQSEKKTGEDTVEAMKARIDFIEDIKETYVLSADELISYTEQQFDLALKLRERYVSDLKDSLTKELEQYKETKQAEVDADIEANNKKIRELNKQIKAIDAIMSRNEYNESQEDINAEIAKLEAEYQKYQFATSYEGMQRRAELEEELAAKRLEKKRSEQKNALQTQKDGLQEEVDSLTEANEDKQTALDKAIEEQESAYEKMYADLETLFEDKENVIQSVRNRILTEKNEEMKAQMEKFVKDYEDAEKRLAASTLSMKDMQNWVIDDAKNAYNEGKLLEDTDAMQNAELDAAGARANGGTTQAKDKTTGAIDAGSTEYQYFKSLGAQWMDLQGRKKIATADELKYISAEQDRLHKEADKLRKKYGVKDGADIPKWPVKYHTGGVVKDYLADANGEVSAKLLPGEVVFTEQQFGNMVASFDRLMTSGPSGSFGAAPASIVNNTYGALVNIENVNNSTNADFRKMTQEMDVWTTRKARANGTRKI